MTNKIFYISDTHFGHANVLAFNHINDSLWKDVGVEPLNDPKDIVSWNQFLINKWNNKVSPNDTVYFLGDFALKINLEEIKKIKNSLNGKIIFIKGNHDKESLTNLKDLVVIDKLNDKNVSVYLSHYPTFCFPGSAYNNYHFYGHIHNSFYDNLALAKAIKFYELNRKGLKMHMYNCSCMMPYMDFEPKTLEEIIKGSDNFYANIVK
jgi:calcineurin-like phosphoesterase family protein